MPTERSQPQPLAPAASPRTFMSDVGVPCGMLAFGILIGALSRGGEIAALADWIVGCLR